MSDPFEGETPSANEVSPEPGGPEDPADLQSAGDLDEDELGADPLEEGMEPSEEWSAVATERPTPREMREGSSVEERLAEERPDRGTDSERPLAETREHELDETVDDRAAAEVADGAGAGAFAAEEPVEAERGPVLESYDAEPTGLTASSAEGIDAADDSIAPQRSPEEGAERIEDSGR